MYLQPINVFLGAQPVSNGIVQSVTQAETLSMRIKNIGNDVFTGAVGLGIRVTNNSVTNLEVPYSATYPVTQLISGDSVIIGFPSIGYPDSALQLKIGGNVVVVWPKSGGGINNIVAADSVTFNLTISDTATLVMSRQFNNRFIVYPNPSSEYVYFKETGNEEDEIERIEVFSSSGIMEKTVVNPKQKLNLSGLASGQHSLLIYTKDKQVLRMKVVVRAAF